MAHDTVRDGSRGLLLVISGPSGAGKTTIAHAVEQQLGGTFSVSATTRPRSGQEVEGRDYFFLSDEQFRRMIDEGRFLEYARVFDRHCYGTPSEPVERSLEAGRLVILDIDVQGGLQVRQKMPAALMVFIVPPNDQELLDRLRGRGRDDEATIQRRFAEAKREIELAEQSGAYDAIIANDRLEEAVACVCRLVERRWRPRDGS